MRPSEKKQLDVIIRLTNAIFKLSFIQYFVCVPIIFVWAVPISPFPYHYFPFNQYTLYFYMFHYKLANLAIGYLVIFSSGNLVITFVIEMLKEAANLLTTVADVKQHKGTFVGFDLNLSSVDALGMYTPQ